MWMWMCEDANAVDGIGLDWTGCDWERDLIKGQVPNARTARPEVRRSVLCTFLNYALFLTLTLTLIRILILVPVARLYSTRVSAPS